MVMTCKKNLCGSIMNIINEYGVENLLLALIKTKECTDY